MLAVENTIAEVAEAFGIAMFLTGLTCATGFTVMLNFSGGPELITPPLAKLGVTQKIDVTGAAPEFIAVKDGMLPLPEAAIPIDLLLLVQK